VRAKKKRILLDRKESRGGDIRGLEGHLEKPVSVKPFTTYRKTLREVTLSSKENRLSKELPLHPGRERVR